MAGRHRKPDPAAQHALETAKRLTDQARKAKDDAVAAWQAAAAAGASAREIGDAVGVPYDKVARAVTARRQQAARR